MVDTENWIVDSSLIPGSKVACAVDEAVAYIPAHQFSGCKALDMSQLGAHKAACEHTWLILDCACSVAEAVVRAIGSRWPVRLGLLPVVFEALLKSTQKGTQRMNASSNRAADLMRCKLLSEA